MGFLDMKKELLGVAFDPNQVQIDVYKYMENLLNGNDIPDPTNPFMFLLESNATIGSVLLEQMKLNLRKLYPVLANTKEDLYHHIYDREIDNIFAYPSVGSFTFSISVQQLISHGTNHGKYYEIIIPTFTKVIVKNYYKFMVLNDIVIRYYPLTKRTMVLTMPSNLDIGFIGNEVLESYVIVDNNNLEWIIFTAPLKQIDGIYINEPIVPTNGYNRDIELNDQLYTIYGRANSQSLGYVDLIPVFSDFVYDVKKPILKCKLKNDKVLNISLYDVFLEQSDFNRIETLTFTTKGKLNTNFNTITKDEFVLDFSLVKSINSTVGPIININPVIYSDSTINGGRNILTTDELKNIIINNTTGDNALPITNYDLKERVSRLGYSLKEDLDSVLNRQYIVTKDLSFSEDKYIYANPDMILDTLKLGNDEVNNLPSKIIFTENNFVVEPFTFFYKDNYNFKPVSEAEVNKILSASPEDLKVILKEKKYFYNIYKYVCDFDKSLDYRVYEVNTPKVIYAKSLFFNKDLDLNMTYNGRSTKRVGNNYIISINFNMDNTILSLASDNYIKGIFKFKPSNSSSEIVLECEIDTINQVVKFTFDLDSYIDNDDKAILKNFLSTMDNIKINGIVEGKLFIYTTDEKYANTTTKYDDELLEIDKDYMSVISVFDLKIELYKKIEYLFSNYRISPTLRRYKRYENDVYLTYEEDIYAKDKNGNYILEETKFNGKTIKQLKILHKKGDLVLDKNGNPIIKHKKGDVILDNNGRPIVDYKFGYEHFLDILTFELEFFMVKDPAYSNFMISKYLELDNFLLNELKEINAELLENTKLVYKPKYSLKDVQVYVNDTLMSTPAIVKPKVVLYVIESIKESSVYDELIRKLNILLQEAISKYNNKLDMIRYILSKLDYENVQYLKIENIDTIGGLNVYNFAPNSNRFILDKKIEADANSVYVPQIDMSVELVKI